MAEKETKTSAGKETKAPAAKKEKKPSLFSRIGAWFRSLRAETKKITWASWSSVRKNTIIVLVCIIILGAVLAVVDYLLSGTISGLGTLVEKL